MLTPQIRNGLLAHRALRRRLRGDRGNTLVETALSIAVLLTLLVGIIECGLMIYSYHFISNAARQGARYAIVRGSTWYQPPWNNVASSTCAAYSDSGCTASIGNIQDYVKSLAFPGIDTANILVTPTSYLSVGGTACGNPVVTGTSNPDTTKPPTCNAYGNVIQVKVQYTFPLSIPFVPKKSITMSSTSMMAITQ